MNRAHALSQLILSRMREFFREPHTIFWVYGFPLILAFVLGLAFSNSQPEPLTIDVSRAVDGKGPPTHPGGLQNEIGIILKDEGFDVQSYFGDEAFKRLRYGKTSLIVAEDTTGKIEILYDPSRPDSVHAKDWVNSILTRPHRDNARRIRETEVTSPGSRYIDFLLPGLVGLNLMSGGLFGVGFVLVDMRVRKLFKRLMATPMHRGDFLLAMLASRLLFLIPEMASLLIVARWLFGVPVVGSWATLVLVVVVGALSFAGLGLLLGCRAEKSETITGLINLVMMPQYLVSGVFFSAKKFPDAIQPLIQALPLTRLNDALRGVMLEGAGLTGADNVSGHLLVLAIWGLASFALALRWFKWT